LWRVSVALRRQLGVDARPAVRGTAGARVSNLSHRRDRGPTWTDRAFGHELKKCLDPADEPDEIE